MNNQPLVSIIINNFNYGRYLGQAVDSALDQTYTNVEVIVVDDGSTDNSREVILAYGNRVIPVLKENGGQASAFNAGFAASHGDIICLLDSDDIFLPNKVQMVVQEFTSSPGYGWLIHGMDHVDNRGHKIQIAEQQNDELMLKHSGDFIRQARFKKVSFCLPATSALCFRRQLLQNVLPAPLGLRITADNYLKLACLMLSPILVNNNLLSSQRIHGENLYTNQDRKAKDFREKWRKIQYNIVLGLDKLEIRQTQSYRLLLGVVKSSLKDGDIGMLIKAIRYLVKSIIVRMNTK